MRKRNALLAAGACLATSILTVGSAVADPAGSPAAASVAVLHSGAPASSALTGSAQPGRTAIKESRSISTVLPFAQRWRQAIAHRDLAASLQAGEDYEAAWQAVEVYINHRSLPLYTDIEVDTQFQIDAGLAAPTQDWPALLNLADHLRQQFGAAIDFISSQPPLSPLFDDLVPLRGARAQLLITRSALTAGDLTKAKRTFNKFKARFPGVESLITLRSPTADQETKDALNAAAAKFADPAATAADLTPLVATLLDRYGFGVNLLNAAARTANVKKTAITDADKTALTQLNNVALGLKASLPKFPADLPGAAAGGATGPGSDFALVQPALEAKARMVNTAATLRSALAAYQTLVLSSPTPSTAEVAAANKRALEQVAIAQQTIVGQFWTDPALQAFLQGLPTS
ncbi:MAG TPA: hypothetical protein VFO16_02685 [Pseudonocardiaceae bacterium]|nr:hypothetical protein [Pseudonocardiaceae bacterium]